MEQPKRINKKRIWIAILSTFIASILLTLLGIYGIRTYGNAVFILTPFFMGIAPTIIYGYKYPISNKEAQFMGFTTLAIFTLGLIFFAIEGLVCIAMAAPLGAIATWIGAYIGYKIMSKSPGKGPTILGLLLCSIPLTGFVEKQTEEEVPFEVSTSIEIEAGIETVWKNVIVFPELEDPTEFLFNAGIAYPIDANIEGTGVGAVRYCNFSTGSFVEPITKWEEPNLLKFDVIESPEPMTEYSFWDVDAPHLHDFFNSKQGQFKLSTLENGNTLLEGTTWYTHKISPDFYWRLWSDYIIHKIHYRVLNHIKVVSENGP